MNYFVNKNTFFASHHMKCLIDVVPQTRSYTALVWPDLKKKISLLCKTLWIWKILFMITKSLPHAVLSTIDKAGFDRFSDLISFWSLFFKTLALFLCLKFWVSKPDSALCMFGVYSGHRNMPRLRRQTAAPCPLWWCVLPHWLDTGWMKWASSAPKSTSTHCTTPGLLQNECGKA